MDGRSAAAILGVDRRASKDELRRAFRARAKEVHPDTGPQGSESAFVALHEAFELLMASAPERLPAAEPRYQAPAPVRGRSIDLRDAPSRTHRGPHSIPRPTPTSAPTRSEPRDARGMTFGDHLAAALARRS